MARAKHTARAETRRRYRQAASQPGDGDDMELEGSAPKAPAASARPAAPARPNQAPAGRPGFFSAFRNAYRPAHVREDIPYFGKLLQSRGFLAALALAAAGRSVRSPSGTTAAAASPTSSCSSRARPLRRSWWRASSLRGRATSSAS